MAKFEQDRHYIDMDGNLRTFTIRDYSKAKGVSMLPSTEESKAAAQSAWNDSLNEVVQSFIEENPPVFGREFGKATNIIDGKVIWNKEALVLMYKEYGIDWHKLDRMVFENIVEYLKCKDLDCRDKVQAWRVHYKETNDLS